MSCLCHLGLLPSADMSGPPLSGSSMRQVVQRSSPRQPATGGLYELGATDKTASCKVPGFDHIAIISGGC